MFGKPLEECEEKGGITLHSNNRRTPNELELPEQYILLKKVINKNKKEIVEPVKLSQIGTYKERLERYDAIRKRIFDTEIHDRKLVQIRKTRERFRNKKRTHRKLKESVRKCDAISFEQLDPRVFIKIKLGKIEVNGLLDSGASISILGHNCEKIIKNMKVKIIPILSEIKAAGGEVYQILGKIKTTVEYQNKRNIDIVRN